MGCFCGPEVEEKAAVARFGAVQGGNVFDRRFFRLQPGAQKLGVRDRCRSNHYSPKSRPFAMERIKYRPHCALSIGGIRTSIAQVTLILKEVTKYCSYCHFFM
jgi:hypothetical protein